MEKVPPKIDWKEITETLDFLIKNLEEFAPPSNSDILRYKANKLTESIIPSALVAKINYGAMTNIASDTMLEKGRLYEHDIQLFLKDLKNEMQSAVKNKKISTETVKAYIHIGFLFGQIVTFEELSLETSKQAWDGIASGLPEEALIRKCWYSRWLINHGVNKKGMSRAKVHFDILTICLDVISGDARSKFRPDVYNKNWFRAFISQDSKKGTQEINKTFKNLNIDQVHRYAQCSIVDKDSLPPLNVDGYARRPIPRG